MVDDIITAIETQLKTLFSSAVVYRHYQPQNFKTPSFLISVTDQNYEPLLSGYYSGKLSLDIQYFSSAKTVDIKAIRTDCLTVQETLMREFDTFGDFRTLDKDARITDEVLHFTFNVNYREKLDVTNTLMESVTISESIKG